MPTLRFHHIKQSDIQSVAKCLVSELSSLMNIPADHINLEVINSVAITADRVSEGEPIIEILAFQRPAEVEDRIAKILFDTFTELKYVDVEVFYIYLSARNYYCDGKHL